MFNSESTYPYPTIVVRVCAFVALVVVLLGDILNLIGIYFRSLTLIIFWQLSFMLYFILAYATLIASFISTLQAIVAFEIKHNGLKVFLMSCISNIHFLIGIYIFYFCIKRSVWTDAYKIILKDEETCSDEDKTPTQHSKRIE